MLYAVWVVAASDEFNPIQTHLVKADRLTVLVLLIYVSLCVLNQGWASLIAQIYFDWRYGVSVLKLERGEASMWRYLVKFLRRWPHKADLVTTRSSTPTRQAFQRIVLLHDKTFMQKSWQLSFLAVQQLFKPFLLTKWFCLDFSQSFIPTIFIFLEYLFKVLFLNLETGHIFGKLMAQNPAKILPGMNVLFYSLDNDKQRCSNSIQITIGFFLELPEAFYLVFNLFDFLIGHLLT